MMKMNCVRMMAVLIMCVLLSVWSSSSQIVDAHGGFCLRSASSNTCPNPPTIDTLNLTAYLGRWYEIGSTASFKLLSEAGLRCNQAVYSSSGGSVRLLNSGQKVLSDAAILQVGAINVATRGICAAARQACADVAQSGNATWRLARAAASASAALSKLSDDISHIQLLNAKINQAGYNHPNSRSDGLQGSVAALKRAARSAARRLETLDLFAAELLKEGSLKQKAAGVRIRAASAAISAALAAVRTAASALLSTGQPNYGGPVTFVNGTITQPNPATSAGKLQVTIGPVAAPYWIIDLVDSGTPSHPSYSAALVYSCSQFAGTVSKSLFVLSRQPNLDNAILSRFLHKAQSQGIYNDCNDPLVLTVQKGGLCGRVV